MSLQVTWLPALIALWSWAFVVALRAAEYFISIVGSFMSLQMTWLPAFVVTDGEAEWFVTSVGYFMFLQATWCWGIITLEAAEWFITAGKIVNSWKVY